MSISVKLCHNSSPAEKITKTLDAGNTYSCTLKNDCSILRPVIDIRTSDNITTYNYMYISDLQRYYFIDDIISLNNNLWRISGHVDVLETYKSEILAQTGVIKRQQNLYNLYLDDPEFKTYKNERVQTKRFKGGSGFTKTLNYVLVINGS